MEKETIVSMIYEAREKLKGVAELTPILSSSALGNTLYLKAENLQKTGSFKIRGAYCKIDSLSDEEAAKGVVACSAGNHAQGVALAATRRGIKSVICMPANAPKMKIEATERYGGEVVLVDGNYDDAAARALQLSETEGYTMIHPFNDPHVIAGQGTVGLEILEQVKDADQIVVPIGGGGLISGVSLITKTIKPSCRIIGVQAVGVPSMYKSFAIQKVTTVNDKNTLADGLHVLTPGSLTFDIVNNCVDDIVTVSEEEIADAIVKLVEYPKIVAEGAGAVSVAAYLNKRIDTSLKTVCIVSGGNVDVTKLNSIIRSNIESNNF